MMLLLLLFFFTALSAQNSANLFAQANAQYQKNECTQALALYEQIPNKSGTIWFNMGNCTYKLKEPLKALLYWKRAYKHGNSELKQDSEDNMKLLGIDYKPLPHKYANTAPLLMQILFFCIFGVFLIVGYFLIRARYWVFLAMSFSVLVSAARITYLVYSAPQQALIMHDNAAIRAGPGTEYHLIKEVPAGTTITVIQKVPGWAKVSHSATQGWIEDRQIENI